MESMKNHSLFVSYKKESPLYAGGTCVERGMEGRRQLLHRDRRGLRKKIRCGDYTGVQRLHEDEVQVDAMRVMCDRHVADTQSAAAV